MPDSGRRATVFARIGILERQAKTLEEALTDDAVKAEARALRVSLERTRVELERRTDADALTAAEHAADAASLLLASLGRTT